MDGHVPIGAYIPRRIAFTSAMAFYEYLKHVLTMEPTKELISEIYLAAYHTFASISNSVVTTVDIGKITHIDPATTQIEHKYFTERLYSTLALIGGNLIEPMNDIGMMLKVPQMVSEVYGECGIICKNERFR